MILPRRQKSEARTPEPLSGFWLLTSVH